MEKSLILLLCLKRQGCYADVSNMVAEEVRKDTINDTIQVLHNHLTSDEIEYFLEEGERFAKDDAYAVLQSILQRNQTETRFGIQTYNTFKRLIQLGWNPIV